MVLCRIIHKVGRDKEKGREQGKTVLWRVDNEEGENAEEGRTFNTVKEGIKDGISEWSCT